MLSARKRKGESANIVSPERIVVRRYNRRNDIATDFVSSDGCLLYRLPDSLLIVVLESYLSLHDIANLDQALCNDHDRGAFHALLRRVVLKDQVTFTFPPSKNEQKRRHWLLMRHIGLSSVKLQLLENFRERNLIEYLPLKWSVVKKLDLQSYFDASCILQHCSNLEDLSVALNDEFDNETTCVKWLANYFNRDAQIVGIATCLKSVDLSPVYSTDEVVFSIVKNCPMLDTFFLYGDLCSDETLSSIFSNCQNLRQVCFSQGEGAEVLGDILTRCFRPNTTLVELRVICIELGDAGLQAIATCFPSLTCLEIQLGEYVTEIGIGALTTGFNHLEKLQLWGNENIQDSMLIDLLSTRASLTTLRLSGFNALESITIQCILKLCPNLQSLTLERNTIIYGENSDLLSTPRLRSLVLEHERVSDEFLLSITRDSPLLETLNVSSCQDVSDVGIYHISVHCRHLTSLRLFHLHGVFNPKYVFQAFNNNRKLLKHNISLFLQSSVENVLRRMLNM